MTAGVTVISLTASMPAPITLVGSQAAMTRQDFTINAGRSYEIAVTISGDDGEAPLDLTGCAIKWVATSGFGTVIRINKDSVEVSDIEITAAAEGELTIYIDETDTNTFGEMLCDHELVVAKGGKESTVMSGLLTIAGSQIS